MGRFGRAAAWRNMATFGSLDETRQGQIQTYFVVLLVPVDTDDPMTVVAQKIAHHVAGRWVAAQDRPMRVRHRGKFLAHEATVAESDLAPLPVLEVVYA
jgi:toluene monooxygenase system protein B